MTTESSSLWTEGPSWWPDLSWGLMILIVVVLIALVIGIVLLLRWRKSKPPASKPAAGPSIDQRLRSVWMPFYARLPRRARHFPTFVVMGEAGVGKSHLIGSRVDWRGQANQFHPSAYQNPLLQLYLGGDAVVHELSAQLLRDVGRATRRALTRLWANVGPNVTVLVVLDARSVVNMRPDDLKTLAQLVRGKLGRFPRRLADAIDVRVCLSHFDQIDGYEEFASVMGTHEKGLDLELLGMGYKDAAQLVAELDEHLAYALTTRSGPEFVRLVRFYDALEAVVGRLHPLLTSLRGDDEWGAAKHPARGLYLSSIVPHSYVGDPFAADPSLVTTSIERYNRGTLVGAAALGVGCLMVLGGMAAWHVRRVGQAEDAVAQHTEKQDGDPFASEIERRAAEASAAAIGAMTESEVLWLRWVQMSRKRQISDDFERTIRERYLLPWLEDSDRVTLLYVVSLIYGTHHELRVDRSGTDTYDALGGHILDNTRWWSTELGLSEQIITYYIESSRSAHHEGVVLPEDIDQGAGREWIEYGTTMCAALGRKQGTLSADERKALLDKPALRSSAEYAVLEETRKLMLADETLAARFQAILLPFDATEASEDPERLIALTAALDALEPPERSCKGCGLGSLVDELDAIEEWRVSQQHVSEVIDGVCKAAPGTAAAMMARTQAHETIERILGAIPFEREQDGRSFFDEDEQPAAVGAIRGYGAGGVTETIDGHYTKAAFEDHVVPVLHHAAMSLPEHQLAQDDRKRVRSHIKRAIESYALAYHDELVSYYQSFVFDPGSKVALPFAIKALTQPTSWFTSFLGTFTTNASPPLVDDVYHQPLKDALQDLEPLVTLLAADKGAIPGLEPYTAILAGLLPLMEGNGTQTPAEQGLEPRLSGLGRLSLLTLQGKEVDRRAQVTEWLDGAKIDRSWHAPFEAAVDLVHRYGMENLEDEVAEAWTSDVRPVVRPLLETYPFDPTAGEDAEPDEIEARVRQQGPEPGTLWVQFELLIGPVTQTRGGRRVLLDGVAAPTGMLDTLDDLQRLSTALWDADGKRIPLELVIEPQALPIKEHEGRVASMAYLSAGGSAVYAFNQRPEPQLLELKWWEQGAAIVALKLTAAGDEGDEKEYSIEEASSAFSFYRLLDQAWSCAGKSCDERAFGLTKAAITKGTRCGRTGSRGTTGQSARWSVPVDELGRVHRVVRYVLRSDPWAPFAVRDCR